jgi:bacterioferritin (cytochrome b1)
MGGAALIPLGVATVGAIAVVTAALLTRKSGEEERAATSEDREKIRLREEIKYLSDRLDKERERTDRLEEEVRSCHTERDENRAEFARRLAAQDEQIAQLQSVVRRLLLNGAANVQPP